MTIYIVSILLLIVSAVAKCYMDLSADGKLEKGWNKRDTWRNKYKNGSPVYGERFPGSTTIFVFLTDFWHLMQLLHLTAIQMAVAIHFPRPLIMFIVIKVFYGIIFESLYRRY